MKKISIIDYGYGNLFSLHKALEHVGATVSITSDPNDIAGAVIVPGVGAFGDGMMELEKRGFKNTLHDAIASGKPFLGICLGMQFLFEKSYEFGTHSGLGSIKGSVKKIPDSKKQFCKVPHVGWNSLFPTGEDKFFKSPLLAGLEPGVQVYFVHSFAGHPENSIDTIANTYYCENIISAAVAKENTFGVQFHPEKSAEAGLAILKNFLALI